VTSTTIAVRTAGRDTLEHASYFALLAFVGVLQVSIAAAHVLLTFIYLTWAALVVTQRERLEVPRTFWPLAAYGGMTLVSAAFSLDPMTSLADAKQLVLFLLVPVVYRLARGSRGLTVVNVIVTVGAASAVFGIVQYGILEYDNLGRRPQGALGHYMTYSGLLMLVASTAMARILFRREDRTWPLLILPALLVALALTFTRSAWVGACVAFALLAVLKDFRLLAALPILAALVFGLAPQRVTDRMYSMFDLRDPTNRDRVAMMSAGLGMIRDRPLTGVGPDVIKDVYPRYRDPSAVEANNPHLHNVPLQIAAERGLPALAIWLWFIVVLARDLHRRIRSGPLPVLPAAGLAAVAGLLAAGMFEYNFGDSEFLMLFLVLVTLPFAAERPDHLASA
jgi:O-antigen ligase